MDRRAALIALALPACPGIASAWIRPAAELLTAVDARLRRHPRLRFAGRGHGQGVATGERWRFWDTGSAVDVVREAMPAVTLRWPRPGPAGAGLPTGFERGVLHDLFAVRASRSLAARLGLAVDRQTARLIHGRPAVMIGERPGDPPGPRLAVDLEMQVVLRVEDRHRRLELMHWSDQAAAPRRLELWEGERRQRVLEVEAVHLGPAP